MLVRYMNTVTCEYKWSPFELDNFTLKILSRIFSNKNECPLLLELLFKNLKREERESSYLKRIDIIKLFISVTTFLMIIVGSGFGCFYCYVNKLKLNGLNTINLIENGLKNWALVRVATTGHDCK